MSRLLETARLRQGVVTFAELRAASTRRQIEAALREGQLVRLGRGRYSLAGTPDALQAAHLLNGAVSHESAARLWMLDTLHQPIRTHVTVPARSNAGARRGVQLHWTDLGPEDLRGRVTSPLRTVVDCARTMPFADALAIADSALRLGRVEPDELVRAAAASRGKGCARARRVAAAADGRAANPFESALRSVVLDLRLEGFQAQCPFTLPRLRGFVDVGSAARRIALEADSFAHHGSRSALDRDCRRYDELVAATWLVLRFSWEQVMFDRPWVAEMISSLVHNWGR